MALNLVVAEVVEISWLQELAYQIALEALEVKVANWVEAVVARPSLQYLL